MKIVGIGLLAGLLVLGVNCSVPENIIDTDSAGNQNQEVDSLELARKNRVDSVSQITMPSTVKKPNTIGTPKKKKENQ